MYEIKTALPIDHPERLRRHPGHWTVFRTAFCPAVIDRIGDVSIGAVVAGRAPGRFRSDGDLSRHRVMAETGRNAVETWAIIVYLIGSDLICLWRCICIVGPEIIARSRRRCQVGPLLFPPMNWSQ